MEVLVLAMPAGGGQEKKARGKKKQKKKKKADPRKLEILDACAALGRACNWVEDWDDCRRYFKRAKEGYEEQLGQDDAKTLNITQGLTMVTGTSNGERIEKMRDLVKRSVSSLGEENVVTLDTLEQLGNLLHDNGEFEEAKEVWEGYLAGWMEVLGEDHRNTMDIVTCLGAQSNMF